jgi:hypothetical protein
VSCIVKGWKGKSAVEMLSCGIQAGSGSGKKWYPERKGESLGRMGTVSITSRFLILKKWQILRLRLRNDEPEAFQKVKKISLSLSLSFSLSLSPLLFLSHPHTHPHTHGEEGDISKGPEPIKRSLNVLPWNNLSNKVALD